jgi:hypothetical protein
MTSKPRTILCLRGSRAFTEPVINQIPDSWSYSERPNAHGDSYIGRPLTLGTYGIPNQDNTFFFLAIVKIALPRDSLSKYNYKQKMYIYDEFHCMLVKKANQRVLISEKCHSKLLYRINRKRAKKSDAISIV